MARTKKTVVETPDETTAADLVGDIPAVVEAAVEEKQYLQTFSNGAKIISVTSPSHNKNGGVDLQVEFEHMAGEVVPFSAHDHDPEPHGAWLYEQALNGAFGTIAQYERPLPTVHDLQVELDKILPDVILGIATEEELSLARALRIQIKAMQ